MKMYEIMQLNESSLINKLKKFAKTHYSDADDETDALLTLFARSLQHAEEDDHRQDTEIALLKQEFNKLKQEFNKLKQEFNKLKHTSSQPAQKPTPTSI